MSDEWKKYNCDECAHYTEMTAVRGICHLRDDIFIDNQKACPGFVYWGTQTEIAASEEKA
jgi:hypothetical protein